MKKLLGIILLNGLLQMVYAQNHWNWNWLDTLNKPATYERGLKVVKTTDNSFLFSLVTQDHTIDPSLLNYRFYQIHNNGAVTHQLKIDNITFNTELDAEPTYPSFTDIIALDSFYFFSQAVSLSDNRPCIIYVVTDQNMTNPRWGKILLNTLTDTLEFYTDYTAKLKIRYNPIAKQFYLVYRTSDKFDYRGPLPYYQTATLLDQELSIINQSTVRLANGIGMPNVIYISELNQYMSVEMFNDNVVYDSLLNPILINRVTPRFPNSDDTIFESPNSGKCLVNYRDGYIFSGGWYYNEFVGYEGPFPKYNERHYYCIKKYDAQMRLTDSVSLQPLPEYAVWDHSNEHYLLPMEALEGDGIVYHPTNPNKIFFAYYPQAKNFDSTWYVLCCVDSNLNLKWTKTVYSHDKRIEVLSLVPLSDGGCLVLATTSESLPPWNVNTDIYIAKHDADGRITSVQTLQQGKKSYTVYPNPAKDYLFLSGSVPPAKALAINMMGQAFEVNINDFTAYISHLKPGIYHLQVFDGNGILLTNQKVVKE